MNLGVETKQRNRLNFTERSGVSSYVINRINHTALSAFHCIIDSSMIEDIEMTKQYSVKYPTRRWPIAIWYNILNVT